MPRVVPSLVGANLLVALLQRLAPQVTALFAWVPPLVLERPWTLVTYMFLHDGLLHLAFNTLGLYVIGTAAENRMGRAHFTALYFLSGSGGALFSMASSGRIALVGASAGVFGLMAPFATHDGAYRNLGISFPTQFVAAMMVALTLWNTVSAPEGKVSLLAHVGGFVGGSLYYLWWQRRRLTSHGGIIS